MDTPIVSTVVDKVIAVEPSGLSGPDKKQMVLTDILVGVKVGEHIPIPEVQAISGLIDVSVQILNHIGWFKHK